MTNFQFSDNAQLVNLAEPSPSLTNNNNLIENLEIENLLLGLGVVRPNWSLKIENF